MIKVSVERKGIKNFKPNDRFLHIYSAKRFFKNSKIISIFENSEEYHWESLEIS